MPVGLHTSKKMDYTIIVTPSVALSNKTIEARQEEVGLAYGLPGATSVVVCSLKRGWINGSKASQYFTVDATPVVAYTTGTRHYADGPELCRRLFIGAVGVAH
jgi:hypothetical protein